MREQPPQLRGFPCSCTALLLALAAWGLLILGVMSLVGCTAAQRANFRMQDYKAAQRSWERRMGLPEGEVRFVHSTGAETEACARVRWSPELLAEGSRVILVTEYNLDCDSNPGAISLHECCHRRMKHHLIDIDPVAAEQEVDECMLAYHRRYP